MRQSELTPSQHEELDALAAMSDEDIDTSDIPEIKEFSNPRRGLFSGSPNVKAEPKQAVAPNGTSSSSKGTSDISESGLESIIFNAMTGSGWIPGSSHDYDREFCIDLAQLSAFLRDTQPEIADALSLDDDTITRQRFLKRVKDQVTARGVVDTLRNPVRHGQHIISLFYGTPTPGNEKAAELNALNRFSITRQLHYSKTNAKLSLDLALFINGLPIATFELKNSLTKQTVADAEEQYKRDRDPKEDLFKLGRCMAHFAVDDHEVRFCTGLKGKSSWFLPFNKGHDGGAGNPVNPNGLKTEYLWKETLSRESLTDIIENFAQLVRKTDPKTKRRSRSQIWPRFHQLDVVRRLLADAQEKGAGQRYLVQHSAGSGKSNSIAWLAHRLVGLQNDDGTVFDSIIVVTDRVILDSQISYTIRQFTQVSATVGHAVRSSDLQSFIEGGKKIIISTVQKFPVILEKITGDFSDRRFAIIIDEAHSSQGGRTAAAMSVALNNAEADEEEDFEDQIIRIIEEKKLLSNASYFAFTATPKNRTLELFGAPNPQPDGTVRHLPFHSYTMKQAVQEGFILDVLSNYTPVGSYYNLVKNIEDDPEFDANKAQRKLRRYVEGNEHAIRRKAEIMVDHFHEQVAGPGKIGGQARAMVVTDGIQQAISYFHAISDYLVERKSPHNAIVAISGEHDYGGSRVSEASMNGFPSKDIADRIQEDPYRILVCADKFQTGYDEPLLHTMYVDKTLSGIRAVQTLSRLNRAHPKKHDVFVLDFRNDSDSIQEAFADYYRTTVLSDETDPNRLHDLKATLDGYQVYSEEQINELVKLYLDGADRDTLDPILDSCVQVYVDDLDEDAQVDFKGNSKGFCRSYAFLCQVLPYEDIGWEKLSIFLNLLVSKLPAPLEEDLSKGILEVIDMDSYRVEKQTAEAIILADENAEIDPTTASGGGHIPEPDMNPLSVILEEFNHLYGDHFPDPDFTGKLVAGIPERVEANEAYKIAMQGSDEENARIEHDHALEEVVMATLECGAELYKLFSENESFKRWLRNKSFSATYRR